MSELNDKDFDLQLKAMFDDAGEEVPGHIWHAIESRLDEIESSKRRTFIPIWLRNTGFAAAAAAAVVLTLIFTGTFDRHLEQTVPDDMIAVADPSVRDTQKTGQEAKTEKTESGSSPEEAGCRPEEPDIQDISIEKQAEAIAEKYIAYIPDAVPEKEDGHVTEEAEHVNSSARPSEIPSSKISTVTDNARKETWTDPFAFDDEEDGKRIKTAITLNGNTGNTGKASTSSGGSPMKASARPRLNTINETGSSTYGIPVSFGLGAKITFTPRWSLGAGVNYTLLTRSFKGSYVTFDEAGIPESITEYSKIRNSLSYIGIPVNVYFSVINSKNVDFYVYAGGTAEKCIDNRYRMAPGVIYKEAVKGFQFSAGGGIGVEFIFGDMLGIYIDPSVRYYFKDKDQPKSIRTQNPLSFGCEIGFRVRL